MAKYVPEPLLGGEEALVEYIQRQFQLISIAFEGVDSIELPELHVAPDKPREGMIILADGTDFDPGYGAGYYGYHNAVWVPLFSTPPHGGLYFSTPAATTIGVAGTYVKAAGTTTLTDLSGFTMPSNNRLTFSGPSAHHFHIVASVTLTTAGANDDLSIGIAKNGAVLEHSKLSRFHQTGADKGSVASHGDVELVVDDYLEIFVTNEDAAVNMTVEMGYLFCMGMRES